MKRKLLTALWIAYGIALVYVLLLSRMGGDCPLTYGEWLSQFFNWMPGREIYDYLTAPYQSSVVLRRMLVHYAGNLLLFVPWGVLFGLGETRRKQFAVWTGVTVLAVELAQLLTMLGSFDMDDVILNAAGAWIGFLAVRGLRSKIKKRKAGTR